MKKLLIIFLCLISGIAFAQAPIGQVAHQPRYKPSTQSPKMDTVSQSIHLKYWQEKKLIEMDKQIQALQEQVKTIQQKQDTLIKALWREGKIEPTNIIPGTFNYIPSETQPGEFNFKVKKLHDDALDASKSVKPK